MALNWIIDYIPGWLGPTAVFLGLLICSVGLLRQSKRRLVTDVFSSQEYLLLSIAGLIFVWAVTNVLKSPAFFMRYTTVYTAIFMFSAKWIEGASAMVLIQKVRYASKNRSWPSSSVSLKRKAGRKLLLLLLGIVSSYALIGILLFGPVSAPISNTLVVVWTLATFSASTLGLTWKVSRVSDQLPAFLLYGTLLILGGAEVVNLTNIAAEIRVFVAAGVGYTLGYLTTLGIWVTDS